MALTRWCMVVAPLLGWSAATTPAFGQTPRGSIAGTVRDSTGTGIRGAELHVVDTDIRATSDSVGRFVLPGVWPDDVFVAVRRLGFAAGTTSVRVRPGEQTAADFVITMLGVQLANESVVADATRGKMASFNARRERGVGAFLTRADIEKHQPGKLSDLLRRVAGVTFSTPSFGQPKTVHMERSVGSPMGCVVQLYADGLPYPNGFIDDFPPETIEGVEIYRSSSELPAEFRTRDATCGLIVLWTRDPALETRKKPPA